VRGIPTADNLVAHVEGIIEDIDGVIRITAIKLNYQFKIPSGTREKAQRALDSYADSCPAYSSIKGMHSMHLGRGNGRNSIAIPGRSTPKLISVHK
jgi:hypothetical protein